MSISKKNLRSDIKIISNLINRYGGETTLFDAHDHIAVDLDSYRGDCVRHIRKKMRTYALIEVFEFLHQYARERKHEQ